MCGIAGIVHLDRSPVEREPHDSLLRAMLSRMAHRGPDDEQRHLWRNVGLGFNRLSIVDLEGGRQPLRNEDESLSLLTNGEIYNHEELRSGLAREHTFRSRSDCEVILHLYEEHGREFVSHINGMFATALLDRRARRLYLVRDRLGIKPLYYYQDDKLLVFASEIKALLVHPEVPRELDWAAAFAHSGPHRPYSEPQAFFKGIRQLPGGHMLEVGLDTGRVERREYWNPLQAAADRPPLESAEHYVKAYRELLDDAVRLRLMADVEYGLFLSGGIDSVSIACLAAQHSRFHTFSVLSQSTVGNGDAPNGHRAARLFGLPNHQVLFDWRELKVRPQEWKRILWSCETFLAGPEQLYKYHLHAFAKRCRPELKVMLLGQGSDELNGGYSTHPTFNRSEDPDWSTFLGNLRHRQREAWLGLGPGHNPYLEVVPTSRLREMSERDARTAKPILISERYLAGLAGHDFKAHPWHVYRDLYRHHLQTFQLWHEDRTAAANSIENRVPFLDHRIVELLYSVPPEHYQTLFWDKSILRQAMSDALPEDLVKRPKVPFFYGEDQRYTWRLVYRMLRAENDALLEEAIAASESAGGILDADAFMKVIEELPEDPEYSSAESLLHLVNMGLLWNMAREVPRFEPSELRVSEVEIEQWNDWQQDRQSTLTERAQKLGLDSIPRFGENVLLVECKTGDPGWADEGCHYILRGTELQFVIEADLEAWVSFLERVDGQRSIRAILDQTGASKPDVWKHLEEAIEQGVLTFSPT